MDWNKKVTPMDMIRAITPNMDFSWIKELLDKWQNGLKSTLNKLPKSINPEFDEPSINTTRYNRPIKTRQTDHDLLREQYVSDTLKFPCRRCDIKDVCEHACDLVELDDNKLMEKFLEHNACPDCGSDKFIEGPSGGAATNVRCRGCGHYFNFGLPLFIHRIAISDGKWQKGFMS